MALTRASDPAPSLNRTSSAATLSTPRRVEGWNYSYFARVLQYTWSPGAAMEDAEQPSPEVYRQAAQKLRELADQSHLPDIRGDLRALAARFERMAAYFEAQCRHRAARDTNNE